MPQETPQQPITLVHMTTVPQSLFFLSGQVGYMKERGFNVYAVSSPGEFLSRFAEQERIGVHPVEMPRRITPLRDAAAVVRIWTALRRIRPHIVHAHTPKGGVLGMIGAWLAGVPVRIYHMHGLPCTTATGWKRILLMWSERIACGLAHQVLCVSASVRRVAVDSRLCRRKKIKVLAQGSINGIDATGRFNHARLPPTLREETRRRHGIPPDALVLGFIGRIVRNKGLIELAGAWALLRREFPALRLMLVGPYEAQDPIPPEVDRQLRDDVRVHLIGENWNVAPLYAAMDVLALPTYREGFPTVLLEAAAMSVPVVATRVPGCIDAVQDGVTGLLVPPYDADSLAVAIGRYLRNADLRERHGAAARERVLRDFRPEGIWQAVHHEYLRCLRRQDGASRVEAPEQPEQVEAGQRRPAA
ncbi:glycosyltransferase family 4 protein [Nitrospira moscoviensis]|uniref:Putative Capsular polysaccharide biosynthesis glycosyltransferase CapM n=1 Tax=Nitrospira moscoviensis TaxID=42253 RepID=A0A0K2GJF2_NITMO|nr:glycosyltransferase family 4 protein [Nitrospira moscoviensis]ALA60762.1 putative Capsular polysaccharide biosynthesis glycosyltransferase CapM [Nitrospira moscoviensis]